MDFNDLKQIIGSNNADFLREALLVEEVDIDIYGERALVIAADEGHLECAQALVEAGVTVDGALVSAARNGHAQLVEFFLNAGAVKDDTEAKKSALYVAARSGHEDCMKLLINAGAEVLNNQCLGRSIFDQAAKNGYVECVKLLLDRGIDVAKEVQKYKGPLEMAAQDGHIEVVKLILGTKVNLGAKINLAYTKAVEGGHTEIVRLLLAEANDTVKGSAFIEAAFNGKVECMQMLLELGINDHAIAEAFNSAVKSYNPIERIESLLNLGLDPKVVDSWGRSPLDVAVEYGKAECVQLFAELQQANASSAGAGAAAEHDFVVGSADVLPQVLGAEDVSSLGETEHSA